MSDALMIEAHGLRKSYGETQALDGLDLEAPAGSILGVLGPNGAGKTTAIRVLTTLTRPDSGTARVAGYDIASAPSEVRYRIGLAGQYAALDENLTGRANIIMIGQLGRLSGRVARARADELLERFDLTDAAGRAVRGYSGGMRRRLDLAASLVTEPEVIFLDEPTTGLDPPNRLVMWDVIRSLAARGSTLLLTTQQLEDADQLADRIVVVDHGRAIAEGTSEELKAAIGGARIQLTVADPAMLERARTVLGAHSSGAPRVDVAARQVDAPVEEGARLMAQLVRELDAEHVLLDDLGVRHPSLDDVFLVLTGHAAASDYPTTDNKEL